MRTYADLSAKLLEDAANFFRELGAANPAIARKMAENAAAYLAVAELVKKDPLAKIDPNVKFG